MGGVDGVEFGGGDFGHLAVVGEEAVDLDLHIGGLGVDAGGDSGVAQFGEEAN